MLLQLKKKYGETKVRMQLDAMDRYGDAVTEPALWLSTALENNFHFCPIELVKQCQCGSDKSALLSRFIFCNLLGIRKCEECGLVFVSPRLTKESMNRFFEEAYFNNVNPEIWGKRRMPIFKDILRILESLSVHTIFDVGAANGYFVYYAQQNGLKATGCDIAREPVEWGRSHLGVTLFHSTVDSLDLQCETYDAVVSLDTLYYTSDPIKELMAMRRLIKPGGYLILRLRNNHNIAHRGRVEGKNIVKKPILPMPHIWAFAPETITHILSLSAFETLFYEPAAYSRSLLSPLSSVVFSANRYFKLIYPQFPILTQSFNIVAKRIN